MDSEKKKECLMIRKIKIFEKRKLVLWQENCELHAQKYLVGFTQAHKCVDILHEE